MTQALAFPSPAHPTWLETPGLSSSGLGLRLATESDLPFLRGLYAQSRAHELAHVPWPDAAKGDFCDSQFVLQHRHYVAHCIPAAFLVVLQEGRAVGRLYLHWTSDELRIVDLLLDAATQRLGIGTALLRWVQAVAIHAGFRVVSLHVGEHNDRAYALYRRLGFREEAPGEGGHRRMVWRLPVAGIPVS